MYRHKNTFFRKIAALSFVVTMLALPLCLTPARVNAQTTPPEQSICEGAGGTWQAGAKGAQGHCSNGSTKTVGGTFRQVADLLIFLVGAISVIMIIIGGLRYTISAGDQSKITSAKNTVLYALVGLVIAALAFAIVDFVIVRFNIT